MVDYHDWFCNGECCREDREADAQAYRDLAAKYEPGGYIYERAKREKEMKELDST